jgi:cytochrome bd ubiquinol oxidase subunit I
MDVVLLSRIQFAVATLFHFLFVPLSIGLPVLVALLETAYVRTGDADYQRHARFWGKLLVINFVVGAATGITLEFQFGTNWSRYSKYVGDVFGPLLAIEATTSFFLESTFIGVWFFGWKKLSPAMHAASMWLVALAGSMSAVWILMANAWMHHPVGYVLRNGRAELTSFRALVWHNFAFQQIAHTIAASFVIAGFFMLGISAYHILRRRQSALFGKSFKLAAVFSFLSAIWVVGQGHLNGEVVAECQPTKLASMEPTWETQSYAPIYLFVLPDPAEGRNRYEIGRIPGALSFLAFRSPSAVVKGLKDFPPDDRPPVMWTFITFRLMVGLGFLFILASAMAWWIRNLPDRHPFFLRLLVLAIPLPYLAAQFGWIMTEMGRQPWIVYGLVRTRDAVSPVNRAQVLVSLVAVITVYSILGVIAFSLMIRAARKEA